VYSAGIVLFEALTGTAPYTGDNAISVAYRHVNDDVPAPSTLAKGIPPELDELVVRATRRDPALRPEDGAAFLAEVQRLRVLLGVPRVPVPVPAPTIADRTVPVTPVERAAALTTGPGTGSGGLTVAGIDAERTVTNAPAVPVPVPAMANATIVRPAPGFRPIGPQGTRAMLRTDLDAAASAATEFVPPAAPPSGRVPVQRPPGVPRPKRPGPPPPPRKSTGTIVLFSIIGVLVLALVGTTTWWFTSGRYRTVPDLAGKARPDAEAILVDNDLNPRVETRRDNTVPSGTVIATQPGEGQEVLRGDAVTLVVSLGRPKVPEVRPGADRAEVAALIEAQGLRPDTDDGQNRFSDDIAEGKVIEVTPQPGTELELGTRVTMVLSKGPEPKPVPDVRNKTHDEAFQELRNAGFEPRDGNPEFNADVEGGRVIRTDPEIGTTLEGDDKVVTVVVSNAVTVPDVGNRSGEEAKSILEGLGLQVDVQAFGGVGRVIAQNPGANSRVEPGSRVTIWLIP
jgi:serine/threonine-protein kinase